MRLLISLVVIVYLVGVGVVLAPVFQNNWNQSTAAQMSGNVAQALPRALLWPVGVYRRLAGEEDLPPRDTQTQTP